MRLRHLRIGAAAITLAALVIASASAASKPRWTVIPTANFHSDAVLSSSGRVWFLKANGSGGFTITSARNSGGRLVDWKSAAPKLGRGGWIYLRSPGRDLVFTTSAGGAAGPVVAVRLMPNGLLGDPAELGGGPPPSSSTGASAVQLRDRAVRLNGITSSRNEFAAVLGVCCDVAGRVVGYGSLPASVSALARLGVDRGGRLWLAWAPGRGGPRSQARIVELDPTSLKARGQPRIAPGFEGFVKIRALVCTDTCRLVLEGTTGQGRNRTTKLGTWAPGDAALTTIRVPHKPGCRGYNCGGLIDAQDDGGRLAIAYWSDGGQLGYTIGTARADGRGRNVRRVSSIREPARLGSFARGVVLESTPAGALGSDGFAALAFYSGGRRAVLRVALLPVR
jgi:hypothetical protein